MDQVQSRPSAKKVPFMSLFFNPKRDVNDGVESLINAQGLLDEIKGRLDPMVQKVFEDRLKDLCDMVENQHKKDGILPQFIYANILNPKRFKAASEAYYLSVKMSSVSLRAEAAQYVGGGGDDHVETINGTLFMTNDWETNTTSTAVLAGEVGEAELLHYNIDDFDMDEVDVQAVADTINRMLMREAANPHSQ